jgi:16S rRNA (cytidine1402-2'-O)-methyltransferase
VQREKAEKIKPGTLYLVSTPIGNLRDITLRALDVLKNVDIIAAEDTRKSGVLLSHYQISTRLTRYHDFNKEKVTPRLIQELENEKSIALVTDAGTPGISDPAFYLVRKVVQMNLPLECIPGATAFVPALIVSGLPTDRFVFEGFLPLKKGRKKRLESLVKEPRTIIIYESPKRINRTLSDIQEYLGNRSVVLVREITKKFEQVIRGSIDEILENIDQLTLKGEFVLVIGGFTRKIEHIKGL